MNNDGRGFADPGIQPHFAQKGIDRRQFLAAKNSGLHAEYIGQPVVGADRKGSRSTPRWVSTYE
jgi:hypothetical protein